MGQHGPGEYEGDQAALQCCCKTGNTAGAMQLHKRRRDFRDFRGSQLSLYLNTPTCRHQARQSLPCHVCMSSHVDRAADQLQVHRIGEGREMRLQMRISETRVALAFLALSGSMRQGTLKTFPWAWQASMSLLGFAGHGELRQVPQASCETLGISRRPLNCPNPPCMPCS